MFMTPVPSTIINFIGDLDKYVVFKDLKYHYLNG